MFTIDTFNLGSPLGEKSGLEHPKDLELPRQLQKAFDHLEAGAAPTVKVLAHCVHGTFPRGWWRQLLWSAGYPFPPLKEPSWFDRGSNLETAVIKRWSDPPRVRFERFLWSGKNSFSARKKAAQELRCYLVAWRQAFPRAKHLILAHSHGGTVAVKAVDTTDTTDELAEGMMTLGTPFVRLVTRGQKGIQGTVGMSLPAISLLGAPLLAVDVLLLGTPASTTMWGWLLPLLAFLALALRQVALAATVLVMACFVGGYVVFKHLVVLSALLTFLAAFASSSDGSVSWAARSWSRMTPISFPAH